MSDPEQMEGVSREAAKAMEEDFHARLKAKFSFVREVFSPLQNKVYFVDPSVHLMQRDEKDRLKRLMVESGVLDRSVRRSMPVNRGVRLDVGSKGVFSGFSPQVCLVGQVLNPLDDLAVNGHSDEPVEFVELEAAVRRATERPKVFHYVGVFAPTGFTDECRENPPRGKNLVTILVEKGADTVWLTHGAHDQPWKGACDLFDLETVPEKIERGFQTLVNHPDLRLKGGHLVLDEIRSELALSDDLFEKALGKALGAGEELQIKDFDGEKIIQRARF